MPEHFSLTRRAWLPVALMSGRRKLVRLCDVSSPVGTEPIVRLATGRADCDASLMEFLIGLLAVAIGPEDPDDWPALYRKPPTSADLEKAFAPLAHALVLDGDGARFFQDAEDLGDAATPVEALFIDAPGANAIKENADHFVKRERTAALSRTGAAIALLTLQTMAPSGGAGHRTSLRGGGPLTTLVEPPADKNAAEPTLWQRLWVNVSGGFRASAADAAHVFPWLGPTRTSNAKERGRDTTPADVHRAHAFFGMPRRIRLVLEDNKDGLACDLTGIVDDVIVRSFVTRPWGTNYTSWSQGHPLSPYYRVKKGDAEMLPVHLQSSRVGYRQWLGLVSAQGEMRRCAAVVKDYRDSRARYVSDDGDTITRVRACGYALDNMKPLDFGEATVPLLSTGSPETDGRLDEQAQFLVEAADVAQRQLVGGVKRALYGEGAKIDSGTSVLSAVSGRFWAETERHFYDRVRELAREITAAGMGITDKADDISKGAGQSWVDTLRPIAMSIFDDVAAIDDADSDRIVDVIEARKFLSMMFQGQSKSGRDLYGALLLPPAEKPKGDGDNGGKGSGKRNRR